MDDPSRSRNGACLVWGMDIHLTKAQMLQKRLGALASQVVEISSKLPKNKQATHISDQLLRSGTSAAANYAEARAAASRADFIHRLRIVLKELNETAVWLQLILDCSFFSPEKLTPIIA